MKSIRRRNTAGHMRRSDWKVTTSAKTLSSLLTLLLLFGSAGQAQSNGLPAPGMLPDHPLYFLKHFSEGIGTLFTRGALENGERSLDLAEKRLAEASALAAKAEPALAERTVVRYQEQIERALARGEEANADGVDADRFSARASVATLKHQAVLADVYERVPETARPAIERAMQAGMRGHEEAMSAISGQRREEAMRDVERQREESGPVLEALRGRGIPVPVVRTRKDVERGSRPAPSGRGRPDVQGRP